MRNMCIAMLAAATMVVGCTDGENPPPTPTAISTVTATATPDLLAVPATFDEYPAAVAAYLDTYPAAATGLACLAELFQAWGMPYFSGERSCRAGNMDDDAEDEVIAVLVGVVDGPPGLDRYQVAVFDRLDGRYRVAHTSEALPVSLRPVNWLGNVVLDVGDINADGIGDATYALQQCGAHTCTTTVHVVQVSGTDERLLTPDGGLSQETATISIDDIDGDGPREIIMYGGIIQSAGAGLQRARTDIYAWDGALYRLQSSTPDPPRYLYHALLDADALLEAGSAAAAEAAYQAALGNSSLEPWGDQEVTIELTAYAYFKSAIAALRLGADDRARAYLDRAAAVRAPLHSNLAAAFQRAYDASHDASAACTAALDAPSPGIEALKEFWYFGYGNPPFEQARICPP